MYEEEDLLPVSLLQHLCFCGRRAALIFLEGVWEENLFTAEGRRLHERTDEPCTEARGDIRIARGLLLRSARLGLSGKADVVEFHRLAGEPGQEGAESTGPAVVTLPGIAGRWQPFPVEYKRGWTRPEEGYEVQLCAQALCLEEMLGAAVPAGALFYGKSYHRLEVALDARLRQTTEAATARLHDLVRSGKTPSASYGRKCEKCSLLPLCLPRATGAGPTSGKVAAYLGQALMEAEEAPP